MSDADRVKWNARYAASDKSGTDGQAPHPFLDVIASELPRHGRALDVAAGTGRNGLWLARHGLAVTLVDISDRGLALAREAASAIGVAIDCVARDLEADGLPPASSGSYDVVACFYFLERALLPALVNAVRPGGHLVFVHGTKTNLQRHAHPSARYLLDDGELPRLMPGLTVIRYDEGWFADANGESHHEARLLATRRG